MTSQIIVSLFLSQLIAGNALPTQLPEKFVTPMLQTTGDMQYKTAPRLPINTNKVLPPQKTGVSQGVELDAVAATVLDVNSGVVLWEKNSEQRLSIASLTKLMTAAVFLDHNPGWTETKMFEGTENDVIGAKFVIGDGVALTVKDLFYVMLTGSANNAARAIAHTTRMSDEEFALAMNAKAEELAMIDSSYTEPTGLDEHNVSTTHDLAILAAHIFQTPEVREATSMLEFHFKAANTDEERMVKATNKLLKTYLDQEPYDIVAYKTGYTEEAGFCLIQQTKKTGAGEIIVVILGSESEAERNQDMMTLTEWTFNNYQWN